MTPEERRAHLLAAAADLLVDEGLDALTMEAVAQRAGVSKSLGWAYFSNVAELVRALLDRELSAVYGRIEDAIDGAPDFEAKVRAAVTAYFDVVDERGAVLRAVQTAAELVSRGENRRDKRVEQFMLALGRLVRLRYRAGWPRAIAQAGVVARVVNAWGEVYGWGGTSRADAEAQCVAWVLAGLDANLDEREAPAGT